MAGLAVFDFDRTIVNDDSDASIIERLREKETPPEWDASNHDWTPYMSEIFERAFAAGLREADILECIGSLRAIPGIEVLLKILQAEGWDIIILSDANTVFIQHWLKTHNLLDTVTSVITNRASWNNGCLQVEPCMRQTVCAHCPSNLCKSLALAQYCSQRPPYKRVVYVGDGHNDYCPSTNLPAHAHVFARQGYPLDELIKRSMETQSRPIQATVIVWDDGYRILRELFPNKSFEPS